MTKEELIEQGHEEEAIQAYIDAIGEDYLDDFEEAYQGQYSSDEDFAQEMAESLGAIPQDNSWPSYCIDWEWAARELMMDYTEENGYYFRNL
jgi:antirestriction protein